MYGRFKSSKGYATRRTAGIFSYRRRSYLRKVGNKYVSKKSRIGYRKSIEKKYNDRAIGAGFTQYGFGNAGTGTTANGITSVGFKTNNWYGFNFNQPLANGVAITQDLLKGIGTGTSTTTRVGNKVKSIYIKGSITLTANQENQTDEQGGEEVVNIGPNSLAYLRTSWRVVIVKDTQSNSTDPQITWDQVFSSGTTTTTRVGNKVKCKYIKGSILVTANQENVIDDQGGEEVANGTTNGLQYLRTSWRVVIVKDTQSNSTDPQITWDQVFTSGVVKTNEEVGGINSELNIGNMGRFVILSDQYIELSAENPQKTVKFVIPGSKVGSVRYNGPSDTALTDKGVYVIAANQSTGLYTSGTTAYPGICAVQSRFCFVDE